MPLFKIDLFDCFLFLYFFTLHADQLGFTFAGYNIRLNNLIAVLLIIVFMIRFRFQLMLMDTKLAYALLLISLSITLSLLFSHYHQRCLIFMGWYGFTVLCYALLPYFLIKMWDAQKVLSLYCASFVGVGLYALLQLIFSCFGINDPFAQQRIIGNIVRPNAFAYEPSFYALYMTPFVMMCNFHYLISPHEPFFSFQKLNAKKILFLNLLFLVSTSTSTLFAYGIFFIASLCLPAVKNFRRRIFQFIFWFCSTGIAFFIVSPFLIKNFFMKFFFFGFLSHHSFFQRWAGIKNAWNVFLENMFLGVGLGGCPAYLYEAWLSQNTNYIFFDEHLLDLQKNYLKHFEPMNVFTEILASLGIVGGIVFCYLITIFCLKASRAFKNIPWLSANLFVSVLVMLIVLQFNQGVLRTYVWVHLAISFALLEMISSQKMHNSNSPLAQNKPF